MILFWIHSYIVYLIQCKNTRKKKRRPSQKRSFCYIPYVIVICVLSVTIVSGYDWYIRRDVYPYILCIQVSLKVYQLLLYKTFAGLNPMNFLSFPYKKSIAQTISL
jgi:hypothetical protein